MNDSEKLPPSLAVLLAQLDSRGITDYRRYQTVRTYLNFRAREKDIPISGNFELTPLCNLDCKMCYVHLSKAQMQGAELLSNRVWKDLIKQSVDAGMMYARLTGGECLTYPGFKEIYSYLRDLGIETVILSNGILMDDDIVSFLKENLPAAVQITLYGAGEDAYERVTGHRVFSVVLENIKRLQNARIPLSVAVTPNAFMTDGEKVVRLLHSMGLQFRINSGLMSPRKETGRKKTDAALEEYVRMVKTKISLCGETELLECDESSLPDPGGMSDEAAVGVRCGAGRNCFSISWRGEMRPCNTFPDISTDVLSLGFNESWKYINSKVKSFPLPTECSGCRYRNSCKHCVAEHASDAPIGHASTAICSWARRMAAEGIIKI